MHSYLNFKENRGLRPSIVKYIQNKYKVYTKYMQNIHKMHTKYIQNAIFLHLNLA